MLVAVLVAPSGSRAAEALTIRGLGALRVGEAPSFTVPASACSTVAVPGRTGVSVLVRDGRITVVAVRTPGIATKSGVAVGQEAARVQAVYGSSVTAADDGYVFAPGPGSDAELRVAFEVKNGRVAVIRVGEAADVLGGCAGGDRIRANGTGTDASTTIASARTAVASQPSPAPTGSRIVVIDPGHNGANGTHVREINRLVDAGGFMKACNTVGTTSLSGLTEAAFNWSVARKLGTLLTAQGWQVIYTREDNDGWGPCVDARGRTADRPGVVALLAVHADGGPASGHGFHVIWPKSIVEFTEKTAASSSALATAVRDAMVATGFTPATYIGRRGLDNRGDLGTLNRAPVPSMLVESGNMRNVADDHVLSSDGGQQQIAVAIASGFEHWWAARG